MRKKIQTAQNGVTERDDLCIVAIRIAPNDFASKLMEFSIAAVLRILISIGASILVKGYLKKRT